MKKFLLLLCLLPLIAHASHEPWQSGGDLGRYGLPTWAALTTLAKNDKAGLTQFTYAFVSTLAITEILKRTVNEKRPERDSNNAFPSGHTSWAFAGAAFLQQRYGWSYGVPAYFAATLVGMTRMQLGAHHPHDVFAGAAIAIGMNLLFTKKYSANDPKFSLLPFMTDKQTGITARFKM